MTISLREWKHTASAGKKKTQHMDNNTPTVIKIHDVNIDKDYIHWIEELKSRYRSAQIKAAVKVNAEKLHFNWELGQGFSTTNLWRMKQWYLFYSDALKKLPQLVGELQHAENQSNIKLAQVVGEFESNDFPPLFAYVPWGHHAEIIAKCKTIEEALFYVKKCATEGWSRNTLMNCIKAHQYENLGGAITNFADKLPSPQSELAQAITKDTYDFGFISLEDGYKEEALETELEKQLTRFLLELGTGFAYLGRQKQIIIAGRPRKLDMLFYTIQTGPQRVRT